MTCPACEDSGEVVLDAFGQVETWASYVESVAEYCRKHGLPERVSAMLHPSPCPQCKPHSCAGSVVESGAEEALTESAPGLEDDGFRLSA